MAVHTCSTCKRSVKPRVDFGSTAELHQNLRSGYGPSFVSTQEVRGMINLVDRDIEDCQAEVIRLRAQITYFEVQQELLKVHKMKLRSLLSPVRKIPNETLSRIVEYVCEENLFQDYPWPEGSSTEDEGEPPTKLSNPAITYLPTMVISSVCSRWRELAISLPFLWSQLKLEISTASRQAESPVSLIASLKTYLKRSSDRPLAINLNLRGDPTEDIPSALLHLLAHTHRWKTFKYVGKHTLTSFKILSNFRFPLLSELALEADTEAIPSDDLDRFEHAPELRVLSTDMWYNCKIPFDRLNSFSVGVDSCANIEQVLRSCPSLTALEVFSSPDFEEVSPAVASTTWHSITSLDLHSEMVDSAFFQTIFSSFNFPSLTRLRLHRMQSDHDSIWPRNALGSFISRSSCSITTLVMYRVPISDVDLIATLRLMPCLRELEIDDYDNNNSTITPHLFSSMQFGGENYHTKSVVHLVPRLRSVRLNVGGITFDHRAFVSMIVSRWLPDPELASAIGVDCLREVFLECDEIEMNVEIYGPLRDLDKMGLMVVIKDSGGIQI